MTAALIAVGIFWASIVTVTALDGRVVRRKRPRRQSTVIVQTRDGQSIRGVLLAEHADRITLTDAFAVTGEIEVPIAGLAHVPASNVAWVQELPLS